MARSRGTGPLVRAFFVLGAVGMITVAVTFAALQSPPAALANNSIESATADLRINKDSSSSTTSITGFDFNAVTPGGSAYPDAGNTFYLKNMGTANLALKASVATTPSVITSQPNGATVDLTKVSFIFTRIDTGSTTTISLKALIDSYSSGGVSLGSTVNALSSVQYSLKVSMASDAFSAQSASISGITLDFTGTGI